MKYLALTFLFLLMLSPVFAQDETAAPVTQAPIEVVVTAIPEHTETQLTQATDENSLLKTILVGISTFVGGMATGLVGGVAFIRAIMNNPLWMALAERVGGTVITPDVGKSVRGSLATVGEFVEDISDDIPESDKPRLLKVTYSDGTIYDPSMGIFTHPDGTQSHDLVLRKTVTIQTDKLPAEATLTQPLPLPDHQD